MDAAEVIASVISSGAIVTATYHIVRGLKTRLTSLEQLAGEQRDYIKQIRDDFKELSSIKTAFIREFSDLHVVYKEHSDKTYKDIIQIKEDEISYLKNTKTPQKSADNSLAGSQLEKAFDEKAKF